MFPLPLAIVTFGSLAVDLQFAALSAATADSVAFFVLHTAGLHPGGETCNVHKTDAQ